MGNRGFGQFGDRKKGLELLLRERLRMRWISQKFLGIERVGFFRRGNHIGNHHPPSGLAYPLHFFQHGEWIRQMMENISGTHDGEMSIRIGKRSYVALLPAYVGQSLIHLRFTCLVQHGGSQVNANRLANDLCKRASQQSGTTSYVQRGVIRTSLCQRHNVVERLLVTYSLRLRKWRRLARELVEDAAVVGVHGRYGTANNLAPCGLKLSFR